MTSENASRMVQYYPKLTLHLLTKIGSGSRLIEWLRAPLVANITKVNILLNFINLYTGAKKILEINRRFNNLY